MLDIGKFDRRILIQKSTMGKDAMGGKTYSWNAGYNCWSAVDFIDGNNDDNQDKFSSNQKVNFTIRNVGSSAQSINANNSRIAFPTLNGSITTETQYYTIIGTSQYGGREKYLVITTELRQSNTRMP